MPAANTKSKSRTVKTTKKATTGRLSFLKRVVNLNSKKSKFIAFILVFAIIGGSYMAFRSFASTGCTSPPWTPVQSSYTTRLTIVVTGVSCAQISSGPNQFNNNGPAHAVGTCVQAYQTFNASGTVTCYGTAMGPVSLSAAAQPGYTFSWAGCDALSPSRNSCWMDQYTRRGNSNRTIYLSYVKNAPPSVSSYPRMAPYSASIKMSGCNISGTATGHSPAYFNNKTIQTVQASRANDQTLSGKIGLSSNGSFSFNVKSVRKGEMIYLTFRIGNSSALFANFNAPQAC